MNARSRPEPPPEAALIKDKLKRARRSLRSAASESIVSETRWRQILAGYVTMKGHDIPVHAPADTLADMARVVGATPAELREAGRPDAAEVLEEQTRHLATLSPQVDAITQLLATLPPEAQDEVFRRLQAARSTGDAPGKEEKQQRRAG